MIMGEGMYDWQGGRNRCRRGGGGRGEQVKKWVKHRFSPGRGNRRDEGRGGWLI